MMSPDQWEAPEHRIPDPLAIISLYCPCQCLNLQKSFSCNMEIRSQMKIPKSSCTYAQKHFQNHINSGITPKDFENSIVSSLSLPQCAACCSSRNLDLSLEPWRRQGRTTYRSDPPTDSSSRLQYQFPFSSRCSCRRGLPQRWRWRWRRATGCRRRGAGSS